MKISKLVIVSTSLVCLMTSCASRNAQFSPVTQLQIRQTQSRDFDTNNTKLVMKSMMNVLQDDGFIIKNAVVDIGLLSAEKNIDIENKFQSACLAALGGPSARWNKQVTLEISANVSDFGDQTRVRVNFQTKTLDNFGCPKNIETVKDTKFYADFFDKVGKGIFIQEQNI